MKTDLRSCLGPCAAALLVLSSACLAQEFKWSWEGKPEGTASSGVSRAAADPAAAGSEFNWNWDKEPGAAPKPAAAPPAKGLDAAAYNELIKENVELRQKIGDLSRDSQAALHENARLSQQIKDMEARMVASVTAIDKLQKEKSAPGVEPDRVVQLEAKLADAEAEKARLARDLDALRAAPAAAEAGAAAGGDVQRGSDLFKRVEEENARLRARLAEVESDRLRLAAVQAPAEAPVPVVGATEMTTEAPAGEAAQLAGRIPDLEKEMAALKSDVSQKDQALTQKQTQIEALQGEIESREERLVKAERMAELMDKTREELSLISAQEKRDMHYNMAVVYATQGRLQDAEREYMRALRVDPNDADVHYNLGILYEQELKDKRKAAMHYRKYLRLRPDAEDGAQVNEWLMQLEMP